ncbi:hypothetical protein M4I33_03945 [Clostridium sp. LY3-2]|uniref:hypothetical protein n=1 Tax=Clostridium sp. LY3-2 TaxID=2942482 RepID=UPI0021522153|nr:hypothetical protein [Clostridium sp. LY3-2]MCR6514029.1 hypothetical protein [Clostridium sp. LY3-2]
MKKKCGFIKEFKKSYGKVFSVYMLASIFVATVGIVTLISLFYHDNEKNLQVAANKVKAVDIYENIQKDYYDKVNEAKEISLEDKGLYKCYKLLLETLNSYNINEVQSAKVVYNLSEELLNGLFNKLKEETLNEEIESFSESQSDWLEKKSNIKNQYYDSELIMYQKLIDLNISICEEWISYYK